MKRLNRNKYERIQFVRQLGFNTEENILIKPSEKFKSNMDFIKHYKRFSIRTFSENDDISTPHYPIVTKQRALKLIKELQNKNMYIILATPIDPKDCEFCGATYKTNNSLITEIALGPGTVRQVTNENKIDKRYYDKKTDNKKLNECLEQISNCHLNNVIFEFSYYKKPIGYKHENFIVWEITDDGTNNSRV